MAEVALSDANVFLDADSAMLTRFLTFFALIAWAFRYVGRYVGAPGKVISLGVLGVEALAKARLRDVIAQKAANDAALEIVRRAAANEARFAIRASGG